jgi:acetyltransferase-like isoleucine patch superfamily enzyme
MQNPQAEINYFVHKSACVDTDKIGSNTRISAFVVIEADVQIGNDVIIHPHVTIESGVTIGDGIEIFPGAYLGKEPKGAGATARKPEFDRIISIGDNCSIGPNSVIYYDVKIGRNTLIGDNASIREKVSIGEFCILSRGVTVNYNTQIGDRTKIMDLTHITGNCEIGNDVFISVLVATTNDRAIGKLEYNEERIQGPKIEDNVAIGAGANILPGVRIGIGSIVAAAAVVSKDIPAGKMVAGNPARVIKTVNEVD